MIDPFDPYDPFAPGDPLHDPYDPFLDTMHPFYEPPDPYGNPSPTGVMAYDPIRGSLSLDTASGLPGPDGFIADEMGPEIRFEPTAGLDDQADPLKGYLEDPLEMGAGTFDQIDGQASFNPEEIPEPWPDPEPDSLLDELEASIEQAGPFGVGPGKRQSLSKKPEYWPKAGIEWVEGEGGPERTEPERILGVSSPDPKIDYKSEKTCERPFPVRQWRPRAPLGIRHSSLSKTERRGRVKKGEPSEDSKKGVKECPRTGQAVTMAECGSCEHFRDGVCAWHDEGESENEERENEGRE